jgi:hypothetical protein
MFFLGHFGFSLFWYTRITVLITPWYNLYIPSNIIQEEFQIRTRWERQQHCKVIIPRIHTFNHLIVLVKKMLGEARSMRDEPGIDFHKKMSSRLDRRNLFHSKVMKTNVNTIKLSYQDKKFCSDPKSWLQHLF